MLFACKTEDDYIVFDNVSFSYQKAKDNITDISFRLKKGETLGIIGATGSGKSTVINLLMNLYSPDRGEIRIGGRNVGTIPHNELYKMFGVVFQGDILFGDTIAENIDFGRGLPREQIDFAAQCAQAKEFIDSVPGGAGLSTYI